MTVTAADVRQRLLERLRPHMLEVVDESAAHAGHAGGGGQTEGTHFRVRIDSPEFQGKPRVACHRLVYDALQDFIDQGVHALAIEIVPAVTSSSSRVSP
jgi:BolA protein